MPPDREGRGDPHPWIAAGTTNITETNSHEAISAVKSSGPRRQDLGDRRVQAAVHAAEHLLALNLLPIFDLDTAQAMWRAGHHRTVARIAVSGSAAA